MVTYRGWLVALGIGLGIVWIVGLSTAYSYPTITWLDFAAAILSFIGAAAITDRTTKQTVASGTILLSLGVFGIWLGALLSGDAPWQTWWTFAFACAYFLVGIAAAFTRPRATVSTEDRFPPRRAA